VPSSTTFPGPRSTAPPKKSGSSVRPIDQAAITCLIRTVRPRRFQTPSELTQPRRLQIHALLDTHISSPVQLYRWHLCLFQFSLSAREERTGSDRARVPARTPPFAFALSLLPLALPNPSPTTAPARRRMAKTTPAQRLPIPMDVRAPRPLFLSLHQSRERGRRRCRDCVCPRVGVSVGGVLHVDVRPCCLPSCPPTLMHDQVDPVYMGRDAVVDRVARVRRSFFFRWMDGLMEVGYGRRSLISFKSGAWRATCPLSLDAGPRGMIPDIVQHVGYPWPLPP
jgi:hypothetical protein